MFVTVNGQKTSLPELSTLAGLLRQVAPAFPFAVARNEEVVPRESYEQCRLQPGDAIEIVHPAAGG